MIPSFLSWVTKVGETPFIYIRIPGRRAFGRQGEYQFSLKYTNSVLPGKLLDRNVHKCCEDESKNLLQKI